MHAIVSAPGYQQVITHVFVEGDPYLDGDAVFAVKDSLVAKYKKVNDAAEAKRLGMPNPFLRLDWDFRLAPGCRACKARKKIAPSDARRMIWRVRRVLTGHDAEGRSTFIADGQAPNVKEMASMPGLALTDLWETDRRAGEQRRRRGRRRAPGAPRAAEERHHPPHRRVPARLRLARQRRRRAPASSRSAPGTRRTAARAIR